MGKDVWESSPDGAVEAERAIYAAQNTEATWEELGFDQLGLDK